MVVLADLLPGLKRFLAPSELHYLADRLDTSRGIRKLNVSSEPASRPNIEPHYEFVSKTRNIKTCASGLWVQRLANGGDELVVVGE